MSVAGVRVVEFGTNDAANATTDIIH